jgi:hypothetical protein
MAINKTSKINSLEDLLGEIEDELETEKEASLSKDDQVLAEVARRMLRLERDMTTPGSATSKSARIERLAKFIEEESF